MFVRGHYLFREANSFPRAKLEENCELRGTDNVQGQISEPIFAAKLRAKLSPREKAERVKNLRSMIRWTKRDFIFKQGNSESVLFFFFFKVVKYTHCPTILTRCGDRIRSNGRSPLTKSHSSVVV